MTKLWNQIQSINEIKAKVHQMVEERYVFPHDSVLPWSKKYWATEYPVEENEYACVYEDGLVPPLIRAYRQMYLVGYANQLALERLYTIDEGQKRKVEPWGVVTAAIVSGTYDAMQNNDKTLLWTQGSLIRKLGVCPKHISARYLRQLLAEATDPNYTSYIVKVNADEDDPYSQWVYYTAVEGRKVFTRIAVFARAILCARAVDGRYSIAQKLMEQWIEKFDHPEEMIHDIIKIKPHTDISDQWEQIERLEEEMDREDAEIVPFTYNQPSTNSV